MTAIRQDAWSADDDLMLAEVTLRHIREGSTQLSAFEEVGDQIGRTAAACGFRWNSCVRKSYEQAIQNAKQLRQKRSYLRKQGGYASQVSSVAPYKEEHTYHEERTQTREDAPLQSEEGLTIDLVIRYLKQWKSASQDWVRQARQFERDIRDKDEELARLREENMHLSRAVNNVQTDYQAVNDDYKTLIQIMDRARRMTVLGDEESKARFKMEANGNLERID